MVEASKQGQAIGNVDLGASVAVLRQDSSGAGPADESVDQLLAKLAKKGRKVKLLDESASVKELPGQEDGEDGAGDHLNVIREQKNDDEGPSAQRLLEQQQEQQRVIEETNA